MTNNHKVVIAHGKSLGIFIGRKMDDNFLMINIIFPCRKDYSIIHKSNLSFIPLSLSDIKNITSFSEFQQTYPEYFV